MHAYPQKQINLFPFLSFYLSFSFPLTKMRLIMENIRLVRVGDLPSLCLQFLMKYINIPVINNG